MNINSKTEFIGSVFCYCKMKHLAHASMKPQSAATVVERARECKCESLKQEESFKGTDQERDIQTRDKRQEKNVWV